MNQFWGGNNVCAISSSDAATLDSGNEATVAMFIGAIAVTSNDVVFPRETSTRNGGMTFLSTEETD